jgi:glucose/arabinose dehydrogenase
MADPNDGSGRLLVVDQGGIILMVKDGVIESQPFLDLTDRVGSQSSEQGLLGIALDPEYASNGIFYLNYTDGSGNTTVSRFHRAADGVTGDASSEQVLFKVDQPFANHNGGNLVFGPDGMLYFGMGDGGSQGDPNGNAQNVNSLLGKMLRIDVRGRDSYTIPADNPFASGGGAQEVWAWGFRNPWRFSFDRLTGDLYIADVGQNQYEEVDFLAAGSPGGSNFGWNYREGQHAFKGEPPAGLNLNEPVFEYTHSTGCSITGGYVYRGNTLPEFYGIYLAGDYCSGIIWGLMRDASGNWTSTQLFQTPANASSFGQDANGELYLLDHRTGSLFKLVRKP